MPGDEEGQKTNAQEDELKNFQPMIVEKSPLQLLSEAAAEDKKFRAALSTCQGELTILSQSGIENDELKRKLEQELQDIQARMVESDEHNIQVVESILANGDLPDADSCWKAALILVHGAQPKHLEKAFEVSIQAAEKEYLPRRTFIPQAVDKYMKMIQLQRNIPLAQVTQHFGTQFYIDENHMPHRFTLDTNASKNNLALLGMNPDGSDAEEGSLDEQWEKFTEQERKSHLQGLVDEFEDVKKSMLPQETT